MMVTKFTGLLYNQSVFSYIMFTLSSQRFYFILSYKDTKHQFNVKFSGKGNKAHTQFPCMKVLIYCNGENGNTP